MLDYEKQREREIANNNKYKEFYEAVMSELDWVNRDIKITQYLKNPEGERLQRGVAFIFEAGEDRFLLNCYYPDIVISKKEKDRIYEEYNKRRELLPNIDAVPSSPFFARWFQDGENVRAAVIRTNSAEPLLASDFFKKCLNGEYPPVENAPILAVKAAQLELEKEAQLKLEKEVQLENQEKVFASPDSNGDADMQSENITEPSESVTEPSESSAKPIETNIPEENNDLEREEGGDFSEEKDGEIFGEKDTDHSDEEEWSDEDWENFGVEEGEMVGPDEDDFEEDEGPQYDD